MPFDARPLERLDVTGYMTPSEVAAITPAGTVREPVLAAVIEAIRAITDPAPMRQG